MLATETDGTLVVAVLALVLSLVALIWQVTTWFLGQWTRLDVSMNMSIYTAGGIAMVTLTAINRSAHAIRVTSAGINLQDGSGRTVPFTGPLTPDMSRLPALVQPHDSVDLYFDAAGLESVGFDFTKPLTCSVSTSDGHTFASKARALLKP